VAIVFIVFALILGGLLGIIMSGGGQ
jgi:hypothetical protein